MGDGARWTDPEGRFDFVLPRGWRAETDDDAGGIEVWDERGPGNLHLLGFDRDDDDFADPAEELYAFLEERGVELQEEEVADVPLEGGGELALCEFSAEDEEDGEPLFWLVGVATAPGRLVFATYFCPEGQEQREADRVAELLGSLRLHGAAPADGGA